MNLKAILSVIICATCCVLINAAPLATRIFNPDFRTLKVSKEGDFMSPPAIQLGTDEKIIVSFDQIAEDFSDLQYRLVHCNADWQKSQLDDSEYIDGFNIGNIDDYAHSQGTLTRYVNYRITLPSAEAPIIHSGNYLLQVFPRENPDSTLLQARFMVYENLAELSGSVSPRTLRGNNDRWQQLTVGALPSPTLLGGINPYSDFRLLISQNGSPLTTSLLETPLKFDGKKITWQNQNPLIFGAGNEYRRFESLSTNVEGLRVDSIRFHDDIYQIYLQPDQNRRFSEYTYDRTQHGRFMVRTQNATDSDLAADYIAVNFTLHTNKLPGMTVFIDGEMTHGLLSAANRMTYDTAKQAYTATLPLKQGSYNYRYLALPDKGSGYDPIEPLEGHKYETENEYWLSLFLSPPGRRADRLVAFKKLQ